MTKITSLTPEQRARFPEFVRKWIDIGLCTQPADRARTETAIAGLYRLAKLREPRVIWMPCPMSAMLSAVSYAAIINRRLVEGGAKPVYSAVDSAVDSAVGSAVGSAGRSYFGGSIWNAGYSAWADYFNEVCGVAIDRNFLEMTSSAGFYWTLDDICFASERPSEIHRNQAGRLHGEAGPAIVYGGTGWGLYAWHGYTIPPSHHWIIADKARLSPDVIEAESNAELRRVMLEAYGFDRYFAERKAKVLGEDVDGNGHARRLLEARVKGERIRVVEVRNGSLEPDGSRRKFLLGAMPGPTPHDVVAASYGINPKHYREAVRT